MTAGGSAVAALVRQLLWLVLACLAVGNAFAQTLDDIDARSQGELRVVRIRFNATVRLLQQLPTTPSDVYTLRFEFLTTDEGLQRQTIEEFRRLPFAEDLPALTITYTPDPANRVKQLTVRLAKVWPIQSRQGGDSRSIELVIAPAVAPPPAATAAPAEAASAAATGAAAPSDASTQATQAETERAAAELMAQAREAQRDQRAETSIALLNQLLKLPPNGYSEEAQEAIGAAWEQAGSVTRARIEYSLYLKLYPRGEGVARVTRRLVALGGVPAPAAAAASAPARADPLSYAGSISQYYSGGKAKSKSLVNIAIGADQATLSHTTESAIVTSVDLSGRYVGDGSETRAVVRGSGASNLLAGGHSSSSMSAAYLDYRLGTDGLALRAGRQSPISGGMLGLFDGVSVAYPVISGLKLDVMGGVPANTLVGAPSERLFATVLEADGLIERWGGSAYLLQQSTESITNRRALGVEARYAGDEWSLNTLADYDTLFSKINALSVHGSFQIAGQTTVTLLADERRAPSLQLTNALISSGAASLKTLLQTQSLDQVRDNALQTSAIARQFLISVGRPLNPRWQMAMDLRYSAIGALPAVGDFEATQATGAQYTFTTQLTGTNLYSPRDINNFNFSITTTPFFKGVQLSFNNVTGMLQDHALSVEPSLRLYTQKDNLDVRLTRVGPGVRLSYKAGKRASLLGEVLYEVSRTQGPSNSEHSQSAFFYLGYRYELF
jgi:hypothetical protein